MEVDRSLVFILAEYIGTVAFSASGALLAIERDLDLLGVVVLGVTTAVGGGTLRDMLLGIVPPQMFENPGYIIAATATALLIFLFEYTHHGKALDSYLIFEESMNVLDAIGLGIFSVMGVQTSLEQGYGDNAFLTIFMGVLTGVGGGALRDIMSDQVPAILKKRVYALASAAGASLYYVLGMTSLRSGFSVLISVGTVILIRLLAAHYKWSLPKVKKGI
ncbi:MAG: trimeric intracellular cation channel family protein [Oscillospiraceae bacterium]|jgi:uncharacterized membrane protein YeiH